MAAEQVGCPAHVPAERLCPAFDLNHSEAYRAAPFEFLREFRTGDIVWSPADGGYWALTTAEQMRDCLSDTETFSSRYMMSGIPPSRHLPTLAIPGELDPPQHQIYRQPMSKLFSQGVIDREVAGAARERARALIAEVASRGSCDFMADFAGPFPIHVFAQWFGLPEGDWSSVERWVAALTRTVTVDPDGAARAAVEFEQYVHEFIDGQLAAPDQGNLFGKLAAIRVDGGRPLTKEELFPMTWELLLGGMDTVSEQLVWFFSFLGRSPEHQRFLRDHPERVDDAVEELLRQFSYVSAPRYVTRDVGFHGVSMKEGDMVALPYALGSLDPAEFDDPDSVDFSRSAVRQMAFGWGRHRCLGQHLARRELAIALVEWHSAIPEYVSNLTEDSPRHGGFMPGYDCLPLSWSTELVRAN